MVVRKYQATGGGKGQDSVSSLRRDLEVFEDQEKRIEAERTQYEAQAKTANTQNLTLQSIQDEIEQAEKAANKKGAEAVSLEIELMAPGAHQESRGCGDSHHQRHPQAIHDDRLGEPGRFFASLGGMTFWELQSRKVRQLHRGCKQPGPALARYPAGPSPASPPRGRIAHNRPQELLLERLMYESIDVTRTLLLNAIQGNACQVVTVTSAMGGEGKTSLSCHLANSLARSGRRTVLVDADLRNPSINRLFDLALPPGLSEALRSDLSIDDAIVPSPVPYLDLIPAGDADTQTMGLASPREEIVPFLDHLREQYDCVIIDTAPVLPITDTLLIAPHADAVILAVLTDVSRAHKVSEAHRRLVSIGAKVLAPSSPESGPAFTAGIIATAMSARSPTAMPSMRSTPLIQTEPVSPKSAPDGGGPPRGAGPVAHVALNQ